MKNILVSFDLIYFFEGGSQLNGYVPDPEHSNSGVTIAAGFDLGCRKPEDLKHLTPELQEKLIPYCGLKKLQAVEFLKHKPLKIREDQAQLIDMRTKSEMLDLLVKRFDEDSTVEFRELSSTAQTVIASVAFQYGNLRSRCPNFWSCAINQNWENLLKELRNFGDNYPTRRNREADYFELHMGLKR